jgi:hypothetical protein
LSSDRDRVIATIRCPRPGATFIAQPVCRA